MNHVQVLWPSRILKKSTSGVLASLRASTASSACSPDHIFGHHAVHVEEATLLLATDEAIWAYALHHQHILSTKGEDFKNMEKEPPPTSLPQPHPIIEEMKQIDLFSMTPLDALNRLADLQRRIGPSGRDDRGA
jgi:hypothetical protein